LGRNLQITSIKTGLSIPNSIAFSPDRKCGYFADGAKQTIYVFDLDRTSGEILNERIFASTKGSAAIPDGSVGDADGYLWNAQWDAWRVIRYAPNGQVDRIVSLPVQRPTCPAFGGKTLSTLFVTSAYDGLDRASRDAQPFAGCVFQIQVGIVGQQEHPFIL